MKIMARLFTILFCLVFSQGLSLSPHDGQELGANSKTEFVLIKKLFDEGCEGIETRLVKDAAMCVLAMSRLQQFTKKEPRFVHSNLMLAELYYYQPPQLDWGDDVLSLRNNYLSKGYSHLLKALELDKENPKAMALFKAFKEAAPRRQTAGSSAPNPGQM